MRGRLTCFSPQGMLSMDVPIMVFHTANLWRRAEASGFPRALASSVGGAYMVTMLGFLDEGSELRTLKAPPRGQ